MALGAAVSGYSGLSDVLSPESWPFYLLFLFVWTPSSLTRKPFVRYLSQTFVRAFLGPLASPRGRVPRHGGCVSCGVYLGVLLPLCAVFPLFSFPYVGVILRLSPHLGVWVVAEWLGPPVPGARFRTSCAMQGLVRTAGGLPRQSA